MLGTHFSPMTIVRALTTSPVPGLARPGEESRLKYRFNQIDMMIAGLGEREAMQVEQIFCAVNGGLAGREEVT